MVQGDFKNEVYFFHENGRDYVVCIWCDTRNRDIYRK